MKPDFPSQDPLETLARWQPKAVPPELLNRLRHARPALAVVPEPCDSPRRFRRFLRPVLAAAAGITAAFFLYQPAPRAPRSNVATPTNRNTDSIVSVTHSREWLAARELSVEVGEDGLPYRVVEGRWLDCSQIRIKGHPGTWTAATPGAGITRVAMPVY